MGAMNEIHLETQELIGVVGDALRANDFDPFDAAGDVADQMLARGWKSPTEVAAERRRMVALLARLTEAGYREGVHSAAAEALTGDIILQVAADHRVTMFEMVSTVVPA